MTDKATSTSLNANNETLRRLMTENGLDPHYKVNRIKVGEMLNVSHFTIDAWLKSPQSKSFRSMPSNLLELFKIKMTEV